MPHEARRLGDDVDLTEFEGVYDHAKQKPSFTAVRESHIVDAAYAWGSKHFDRALRPMPEVDTTPYTDEELGVALFRAGIGSRNIEEILAALRQAKRLCSWSRAANKDGRPTPKAVYASSDKETPSNRRLLGEILLYIVVASDDVADGLGLSLRVERLILEEGFHASDALLYGQVEGEASVFLGEDEPAYGGRIFGVCSIAYEVVQVDQEQREGGESLLAVDHELLRVLVAYDDGTEEVVPVLFDSRALVRFVEVIEEFTRQVVQQFLDLLGAPPVLSLIIVYAVPGVA